MTNAHLPMPEKLEPKSTARTLHAAVRHYFYAVYNSNPEFKNYLASVGNEDAITGNRVFDRHVAVELIQKAARSASDACFEKVTDGKIYQHVTRIIAADHPEIGLRQRRIAYRGFTQPRAAAAA